MRVQATSPWDGHNRLQQLIRRFAACLLLVCAVAAESAAQDTAPRWRAGFVDTFNSRVGNADEVATVVARAVAWNVNVLYVQVRRRGDAFYLDGSEPAPEGVTIDGGFDPLGDLLSKARAAGLEVHALLTLGPVWHLNTAPQDPRHVFTRHGLQGGRAVEGAENWLTRTLQPDGNGTSMEGYRFGSDYWLDFGHPAAANYVVDLVTRLVERYPVDGVRLDALHYPEAPSGSASIGYNAVSVARFQARTGQPGVPGQDDGRWSEWRREQITALTRRLAISAYAVRPSLVVSVSAVAAGAAPGDPRGTVAFSRTFQDWFRWAGDGSVDVIVPQVYRQEHVADTADEFSAWTAWLANNPGARPFVIGLGAYQNSLEGLLRQARVGLAAAGQQGGVSIFSLAATNAPVVDNPLSLPAGRDTPQRAVEDVAAGLRTGRTTGGQVVDPIQPPLFAVSVPRPATPWKGSVGHVLGRLEDGTGMPVDGAQVHLDAAGRSTGPDDVVSDGSGVFATPAVAPGSYRVHLVSPAGGAYTSDCTIEVSAQNVTRITLTVDASRAGVASCR
ncbi:family 10 glycosylhydrolase [Luteitalea pratensis]|uniref:family 10 glycosylhydrolase n=1 Tax=Luteitalea pratensis TaxID=1855912 RepID=UPI001390250C|nr:family 10 glycosylhydrolase [Luteitalea pratensis]